MFRRDRGLAQIERRERERLCRAHLPLHLQDAHRHQLGRRLGPRYLCGNGVLTNEANTVVAGFPAGDVPRVSGRAGARSARLA